MYGRTGKSILYRVASRFKIRFLILFVIYKYTYIREINSDVKQIKTDLPGLFRSLYLTIGTCILSGVAVTTEFAEELIST